MAVTVTAKNYTLINACEASGDWSALTPTDISDFFKEGTQCIGFEARLLGDSDTEITGTWDLSGTKHFRAWLMTTVLKELNTEALGGIQLYVSDGVNTGYYYLTGSDTYPGGWINLVVDLSRNVDSGTKPDMSVLTTIGFRFNLTVQAKKAQNVWIDHLCVCDGLIAYGDDAGSSFDFADILAADEDVTNGWGIIRKIGGVYYAVGSFEFGDTTGDLDFKDISQVLIFEDRKVNADLYAINLAVSVAGTNKFHLGNKSGTMGIQGCVIRSEGTAKYAFMMDDEDIDELGLYGCSFFDAGVISLPSSAANREVLSCSFEACDRVEPDTCVVDYCNFVNADTTACYIVGPAHNVTNSNFIACGYGTEHPAGTETLSFDALKFSNNVTDILYWGDATDVLTINLSNGANPTTWYAPNGGTVYFPPTVVVLKVTVKDEAGDPIENAQTAIYKTSDDTKLMNEDTLASGIAEESFNYVVDTEVYIRVRKSTVGTTRYQTHGSTGVITADGLTITVTLKEEPLS